MRECPGGKPGRGVKAEGADIGCLRWEDEGLFFFFLFWEKKNPSPHHRPTWIFLKGLSQSVFVGTRKIVNYG